MASEQQAGYPVKPQQQQQQPVVGQTVYTQPQHYVSTQPPAMWKTGICDCSMDGKSCLEGWCCSWCQQGRQYNVIKTGSQEIDFVACCGSFVIDYFCSGIGSAVLAYMNRDALRRRYNLEGGSCSDCLHAVFCTTCVVCQNYREMSLHGEWPSGFIVSEPFVMPQVMGETQPIRPAPQQQQQPSNYPQV
jgi:Cys-rich protein (TIGR01571 family)